MTEMLVELLKLFLIDAIFVGLFVLAVMPLAKYKKAAYAILKRNFVAYFTNPTGYVFLCMFVLLSSFAAFWPHEFFAANLASLDQLNIYFPYIMLVFIPAITMSIWADERRQGTDELLLTLPADDFDVVIGKYLAAAAIYSASLLFAQLCHYMVLVLLTLGRLDTGLLCANYFGYWLTGLAMLSLGMVASFLTRNLTVGFILGTVFNAPLVFLEFADAIIPSRRLALAIASWSITAKLDDFGRGVVSLSSITYFLAIVVAGLYLCMILIGSRHWWGGREGTRYIGHYAARTLSLLILAVSLTVIFTNHDLRQDVTRGRVSSLSPDTLRLVRNLKPQYPIYVDAFISAQIPEQYVQTAYNLRSLLKEFSAKSSSIHVRLHDNLEPFSEEAVLAERRFGIRPQTIQTRSRGAIRDEQVILGAAFTCGLEKVVVPFFDYGVSVEYELIRSLTTVAKGKRWKLGVVRTDAQLFSMPTFEGGEFRTIPQQMILDELQKQFDVEQVDPESPIEPDKYDVLMVVQPSSLSPEGLDNLLAAIRAGVPTAIFEDPMPVLGVAPGTAEPRRGPGGMFGMMQGPQPKGDIQKLWDLLGLIVPSDPGGFTGVQPKLAWQDYNPYPKLQLSGVPDTWVFASPEAPGGADSLNPQHPITSGLPEILFPIPGMIEEKPSNKLDFTVLVKTGTQAGRISYMTFRENLRDTRMLKLLQGEPTGAQILAALITGELPQEKKLLEDTTPTSAPLDADGQSPEDTSTDAEDELRQDDASQDESNQAQDQQSDSDQSHKEGKEKADSSQSKTKSSEQPKNGEAAKPERKGIRVIYVTDLDLMMNAFLQIRARPDEDPEGIRWRFENVTFILNAIDYLAGIEDYMTIRKHRPVYYNLRHIENQTESARQEELVQRHRFMEEFNKAIEQAEAESRKAEKELQDRYDELVKKQQAGEAVDPNEVLVALQKLQAARELARRRLEQRRNELARDRDRKIQEIQRKTDRIIAEIQYKYKLGAILLPPVPPLLVGVVIFTRRRLRERESISRRRLVM
ncbi:MAG: hypothetical protein KatS3mg110_1298 [Pirellulaceae bacterium]|nr:MAG: hypothetical protein KatS3mg110_1298 [Pirellulaceae bacterium]